MERVLRLHHGSPDGPIETPDFANTAPGRDFTPGFHCALDVDMAWEWACSSEGNGFVSSYTLDTGGLNILRLDRVLPWLALLMGNRTIVASRSPLTEPMRDLLIPRYLPDTSTTDLIIAPRGDDSHFALSTAFLDNMIPLETLATSLSPGEQMVVVSERAFGRLEFQGAERTEGDIWFRRRKEKDYRLGTSTTAGGADFGGTFAIDLLRTKPGDLPAPDAFKFSTSLPAYADGSGGGDPYVYDLSSSIGAMFHHAVLDFGLEGGSFFRLFAASAVAREIQNGNPKYLAGMSGQELLLRILGTLPEEKSFNTFFDKSPEFWAGWAVARYSRSRGMSFGEIEEALPFHRLLALYNPLHEASNEKVFEVFDTWTKR